MTGHTKEQCRKNKDSSRGHGTWGTFLRPDSSMPRLFSLSFLNFLSPKHQLLLFTRCFGHLFHLLGDLPTSILFFPSDICFRGNLKLPNSNEEGWPSPQAVILSLLYPLRSCSSRRLEPPVHGLLQLMLVSLTSGPLTPLSWPYGSSRLSSLPALWCPSFGVQDLLAALLVPFWRVWVSVKLPWGTSIQWSSLLHC